MELKDIKELLKAFDESESSYFSLELEDTKIKLKKPSETVAVSVAPVAQAAPVAIPQVAAQPVATAVEPSAPEVEEPKEDADGTKVLAPLVGVFYAAPTPEASAYVQVGDTVKEGQILCLIEAMKMMSEITAPKDGVIKKIYVKNQDVVGFEDPLFLIGD
ncbi:acetyl-CoA carboxylase biotin carboxyl carrier protein [Pseudobutyrivibrio sp.]|uniref:acetyl-CoA carboxylase biotin carboxyl carrier protein n=1 Tax=Pseudobutyrivibrio sp. TaxID=2014367 RepID=UPI001B1771C6|nr:acetyl-CoA carboxylase biotin carboxyl carrier protein [Pseudobutyrivibrio sp.]MBO5617106.1 acetyl-CoA carboxylase biotin carboxyl carrier protein [Pseudobutyrivibrio sp.]MBP3261428.1 acetyl-CoA carboxylase biotin carboxyl carrier protein [Pseudobutyrivibrio sp.]